MEETKNKMINKDLLKQFSSMRFISILTPDTFCRKMIVLSLLWNTEKNEGEIAIKQIDGLNNLSIGKELDGFNWNILEKIEGLENSYKRYLEIINNKKFIDCEVI